MEKTKKVASIVLIVLFVVLISAVVAQVFDLLNTRILNGIVAITIMLGVPLCFLLKRLHHKLETANKEQDQATQR